MDKMKVAKCKGFLYPSNYPAASNKMRDYSPHTACDQASSRSPACLYRPSFHFIRSHGEKVVQAEGLVTRHDDLRQAAEMVY